MNRFNLRFVLMVCVLAAVTAWPALGEPMALTNETLPIALVARKAVPSLDLDKVRLEDQKREQSGLPPRFAVPTIVSVRPATDGTWENIDENTLLWRLRIGSPGAESINLGFSRYQMPQGGQLYVYAADYSSVIRPFNHLDNETHGELWTPVVPSDEIVVELTIPAAALPALDLELGSINVGYRGFGARTPDKSGSCNVDVICPQGDGWRDQIKSVAVISTGGSTFCTGFAVNNTARDRTPYFMTANHCGIGTGNAASLVAYWNYENSTCRPPGSGASGGPGDGSLSEFNTGSFFRASNAASDFTLVELDDDPNPDWEVVFAGWDRTTNDFPSAVAIHHPNTDEKRISFEYDPTTTTSYLSTSSPGDGNYIRITDWDLGTTEPGSSGSPLFNHEKRIVGQLKGGYAACGNDDSDWYGRFSSSWNVGGSASTRLSDWLDPGNTGEMVIDHLSTAGLNVTPAGEVLHIGDAGGPFTNPTVTYTLTNPTALPLDYSVSLTASFGILLDGGTSPVTGTLAANGGTVDVIVTLGSAIDSLGAGIYVEDIVFDDLTNIASTIRRHTVEIGQTRFAVVPDTGLLTSGPLGGPFPGSVVYTVTSERPTPVTVAVAASAPWISVNGGAGPVTLNLSGTGDSTTVTIAISASADALSAGVYNGTVSFTNMSGGAGDTTRPVMLDVGRVVYYAADTPQLINDNSTTTSTITINDPYCIGDLDVVIDITHSYIGDLVIDLESPEGIVVRLHNRSGGSADNIVQTYDDAGIQPDGPGLLADFNSTLAMGTWILRVSDQAGGDSGTLNSWALRLGPATAGCVIPELIYSFPLDADPGWTVEGLWAFGQPTGGGSYGGDPTSGHTGANVYGFNLDGDYTNSMPQYFLTTPAIDCAQLTFVELRFWRWLGAIVYDRANVEVSADGAAWTPVWAHYSEGSIGDVAWSQQSMDISAIAAGQPQVFIRWGMGATNGSLTAPGWNIDDIEIWGAAAEIVDCNGNGIDDPCDVDCGTPGGTCDVPGCGLSADCDGDGVLEECQLPAPATAETDGHSRNRFVSFIPPGGGQQAAIRVRLVQLYNPNPVPEVGGMPGYAAYEGEVRWVGPPTELPEANEQGPPFGGPTWMGAALQCQPYYRDWGTVGLLHVYGAEILPDSTYDVQIVRSVCDGQLDNESVYSAPLVLTTARWGDVALPFAATPETPAQPDFVDISAIVSKFVSGVEPPKVDTMLRFNVPPVAASIDFRDIAACVNAFSDWVYANDGPCPCPSTQTCPTLDACERCTP